MINNGAGFFFLISLFLRLKLLEGSSEGSGLLFKFSNFPLFRLSNMAVFFLGKSYYFMIFHKSHLTRTRRMISANFSANFSSITFSELLTRRWGVLWGEECPWIERNVSKEGADSRRHQARSHSQTDQRWSRQVHARSNVQYTLSFMRDTFIADLAWIFIKN